MSITVEAVFDGDVLRPDEPLKLTPNKRYSVTIQDEQTPSSARNAWDVLGELAGTYDGPGDWSIEHDHYIYGTPKKTSK